MKKSLSLVVALVVAGSAFGQGTINFNTLTSSLKAPVYNYEPSDATLALHGNTSSSTVSLPVGTTVYNGARLEGTGYSAQLFGSPSTVTDSTLLNPCTVSGNPLIVTFRTGSTLAGTVNAGGMVVPGAAAGTTASIQMRAWNNNGGLYTTYAQAAAAPGGLIGSSTVFTSVPLADPNATPPGTPVAMTGLTSFNIHYVPEPSTIALGVIGTAAFLARRRKQQ